MIRMLFLTLTALMVFGHAESARAQAPKPSLGAELEQVYLKWRQAMVNKDFATWQAVTARHRQVSIKNRILSERNPFAQTLFSLPAAPPSLVGLRAMKLNVKGSTATLIYYGKVNFEVGGKPSDNLLVLSFAQEGGKWKYDTADFVNLAALPEVRTDLAAGKTKYLEGAEFMPSGNVQFPPIQIHEPVKYIAKVYAYCPGREVNVTVNLGSTHRFQNAQEAQVIIGGAKDGRNTLSYTTKFLPGAEKVEPMTIRVYLFSEVQGVKPLKKFEYLVPEDGTAAASGQGEFTVGPEDVKKLLGR